MVYTSDKMSLVSIRNIHAGAVEDIYICRDIRTNNDSFYTLILVRDHDLSRILIEIHEDTEKDKAYIDCFSWESYMCFVYPYRNERPIGEFLAGDLITLSECEEICTNLVVECISSSLPYPLLYLLINGENVHIANDNSIYFSYYFHLEELDVNTGQQECVAKCAELILALLQQHSSKKGKSYELISMKIKRNAYRSFPELYRDIKMTEAKSNRKGFLKTLKGKVSDHKDTLFHILITVCIGLVIIALLMVITQIFWGENFLFKLFSSAFQKIGTESLLE